MNLCSKSILIAVCSHCDAATAADRLPNIKLRTTRRINGDCLATIMTHGGGLKRRKKSQPQVCANSVKFLPLTELN